MEIQMTINIRWFSNKGNKRNCNVAANDNKHEMDQ